MAGESGRLGVDPLFLGLTRPPMMLGVTYLWFVVNGFIWCMYFINYSDFSVMIPGAIVVHAIGFYLCSKDPRIIDIAFTKARKCMRCRNSLYHSHTHSYDLY